MKFLLLTILLISPALMADEDDENTINTYNTYNYYQTQADNWVQQQYYAQLLQSLNPRPYGCIWSVLQVPLSNGKTVPFFQCK